MPGLASLAGLTPGQFLSGKTAKAALYPLGLDDEVVPGAGREFQYWPETVSDSKVVDYAQKTVPGASHPLVQWVAGGARELSFMAVFSRDHAPSQSLAFGSNSPGVIPAGDVGQLASGQFVTQVREDQATRNVDVNAAVAWFRQHLYPGYSDDEVRVRPPSKLLLYLPRTNVGVGKSDLVPCVMTKADVEWKSWFPDGTPRLAEVALSFLEVVQLGGAVRFVGREDFLARGYASLYGTKRVSG